MCGCVRLPQNTPLMMKRSYLAFEQVVLRCSRWRCCESQQGPEAVDHLDDSTEGLEAFRPPQISEIGPRELDGHDDVCVSVCRPNIPLLSRYLEAADLRS